MKSTLMRYRQGWTATLAGSNETPKLELLRAWEPWTSRSLRKIVREQAPNVCFLMETRLDKEGFEKLYDNLPFPNQIIAKNMDSGGSIALIWKSEVSDRKSVV